MTRLIIARHGNTFDKGDTVLRVGSQTDLPLSLSGREQAKHLGLKLKEQYGVIDVCFVSELKRAQETASLALDAFNESPSIEISAQFNEIDYGIDDGKPESAVVARIGEPALRAWEEAMILPDAWCFDVDGAQSDWSRFADRCLLDYPGKNILVVTSNGIARFAAHLAMALDDFRDSYGFKLKTGAYGVFEHDGADWCVAAWNSI